MAKPLCFPLSDRPDKRRSAFVQPNAIKDKLPESRILTRLALWCWEGESVRDSMSGSSKRQPGLYGRSVLLHK